MNIGLVTDTYYPRVNGVGKSIDTFAHEYRKLGHRVIIFAPCFPEAEESTEDLWRFPSRFLKFNPEDRLPKPKDPQSIAMFRKLPGLKLDILHTQTPFTLGIAMAKEAHKLKLPVLHTYHTLFEAYLPHYMKYLPHFMHKSVAKYFSLYFCNMHDQIVVPSSSIKAVLESYKIKVPIKILPTGINLLPFKEANKERMRVELGIDKNIPLLLSMGRVAHEKNIPFLFDMLEKLIPRFSTIKMVVAGQGPALESVKADCERRKLGNRVHFVGLLNTRDWVDLYAAADVFCLASLTETQGLVLTEAMAAGTPCVAVAAMGVKDVMAGGGGLAVKLDLNEYTEAVSSLLSDKKLRSQKMEEAKRQAIAWSSTTKAEEMLANYQVLIDLNKRKLA